jgi:hypothetical protein
LTIPALIDRHRFRQEARNHDAPCIHKANGRTGGAAIASARGFVKRHVQQRVISVQKTPTPNILHRRKFRNLHVDVAVLMRQKYSIAEYSDDCQMVLAAWHLFSKIVDKRIVGGDLSCL